MTQLHISLSDSAHQFVADQVVAGKYSSPSDFVQELVEQASVRAATERLAILLDDGDNSGPGTEYSEKEWAQRVNELRARVPREKAS